jgi:glycosyltransferase involved in cell wall biosynthesis
MKIVDVNPYFYPWLGGIEHRMHRLAKELAHRGHDVTIVTGQLPDTKPEEETEYGYRVVRIPSKHIDVYNPPYISSKGLLETLNKIDADIVNYNYRWAPSYNKDMAKYKGKKVFTYHNTWGEGEGWQRIPSSINDSFFKKTLDTFDHIIVVSEYVRDVLIEHGYDQSDLSIVYPCMETYPDISNSKEGDFILSLGRLISTKGLRYLVDAMKDVDYKLVICGRGPEAKHLEKQIAKNGLGDRIEMKGWVSEEEKDRLQRECKFMVMPSLEESFGLAAVEMLSYGHPVICTNVGGLPDTVKSGGVLVKPRDSKALADAMNALLRDDKRRAEISVNARKVAESYDVRKVTDDLLAVFESVLRS